MLSQQARFQKVHIDKNAMENPFYLQQEKQTPAQMDVLSVSNPIKIADFF